jgi:hypothetical protein
VLCYVTVCSLCSVSRAKGLGIRYWVGDERNLINIRWVRVRRRRVEKERRGGGEGNEQKQERQEMGERREERGERRKSI